MAKLTFPKGVTVDRGAKAFLKAPSVWHFPFTVIDPTPGGQNLGRIEWHLELLRGLKSRGGYRRIGGFALWAAQTRDDRYVGRFFVLPGDTAAITTRVSDTRADYTKYIWHVGICTDHENAVLTAYPANEHGLLVVNLQSSISADVYFEAVRR